LAGKKLNIKAHIGAEIAVQTLTSNAHNPTPPKRTLDSRVISIPLLVQNRTGYQNLCRLITLMKLRVPKHAKPGECAVTFDELAKYADGLVCLTGADDGPLFTNCLSASVASSKGGQRPPLNFGEAQQTAERLVDIFGRENVYAELQRHFNRNEE